MIFELNQIFRLSYFLLIFSFYRAYLVGNIIATNHNFAIIFNLGFFESYCRLSFPCSLRIEVYSVAI